MKYTLQTYGYTNLDTCNEAEGVPYSFKLKSKSLVFGAVNESSLCSPSEG